MRTTTILSLAFALCTSFVTAAAPAAAATPVSGITSGGPLTAIWAGTDLSCQAAHSSDLDFAFFPASGIPGDCGTFLTVGGTLFAPDFENHPSSATDGLGPRVPFTPAGQDPVAGSGTPSDPYRLVTRASAGTTGISVVQTDSYVEGAESYRTDVEVVNEGSVAREVILYRAADCNLADGDSGFGAIDATTGAAACTLDPHNEPPGRIQQLLPLTAGNHLMQGDAPDVWSAVGTRQPLPGTCRCEEDVDNAVAIGWSLSLDPGQSTVRSHLTAFMAPSGDPLPVTTTAHESESLIGETNGYTITVTNPNEVPVRVDAVVLSLPEGFSYISGSTEGVTSADPSIQSDQATWRGPFLLPADESLELRLGVEVSPLPGEYEAAATAVVAGFAVEPAAPAPVVVDALELTTTKTADLPGSRPGGHNGYTIYVHNPNAAPVTLTTVVDTLPSGFSYVEGSTTGTIPDPDIMEQTLTWHGPFTAPAEGAFWLRFGVTVSVEPGAYDNVASGTAVGVDVTGSGPTARVRVRAPTALQAEPAVADLDAGTVNIFTLAASLLEPGTDDPLPDRPVEFYVGQDLLCTARTDAGGRASCEVDLTQESQVLLGLGYQALFPGDADHLAAADSAPLVRAFGSDLP